MAPPKQKGQKMGLGEFLTDASLGSWADEMEDAPMPSRYGGGYGSSDRSFGGSGATSSYQDRGYAVREPLPLPSKPPYTVHLGNMSFDATEADIQDFFSGCEVTNVRIVEDKIDRKPKGFGYVEFGTIEGLKKALELNGMQFQGRNMRVSVAEPQKERSDGREISDWTRKGPLPDLPRRDSGRPGFGDSGRPGFGDSGRPGFGDSGRPGFGDSGRQGFGEAGADRNSRRPFEQADGKVRDFGNWERKGPLQPAAPAAPPPGRPSSNDGPRERRNSPAWGEGRSQDGSRPPRRDFSDRPPPPERVPTAAEQDNQWRARMRPDPPAAPSSVSPGGSREPSVPSSPAAPTHAAPAMRPKLNLQKRTVTNESSGAQATTPSDTRASPFGAARPIDTAAREKEIEEKLRIKKEQEEKAREEKRAADEKAKEERRLAKDAERSEKGKGKANGQSNDGEGSDAGAKNYQILRRDDEQEQQAGDAAETTAASEGQDAPSATAQDPDKTNGIDSPITPAGGPDDDGWNTVTKPQKSRKGGNVPRNA